MDIPKGCPLVYVSFSAEIVPNTTENLINAMASCVNSEVQQVHILLSTPGGNVREGINLYNVLKGMPFELITHNVGEVNSVGNTIFLAGKRRYATPNSTFMFHGVGFTLSQNQRFEEKDIRDRLNGILKDQRRIGDIISQHTNLTAKEIRGLFRTAQIKDARFAMDKGIIHEIRDVQLIKGSPIISLVFKR